MTFPIGIGRAGGETPLGENLLLTSAKPKHVKPMSQVQPVANKEAIYTCPMHPEVRQIGPGTCPKCGMVLEPETVSLEEGSDPELIDMTRRFWVAAVLSLPLALVVMGAHLIPGISHEFLDAPLSRWIQLFIASPVVL